MLLKIIHLIRWVIDFSTELKMRKIVCILILFILLNPLEIRSQVNSVSNISNNSIWYLMTSAGIPIARYLPIDGLDEDEHNVNRSFLSELEFGRQFNKDSKFTFELGISFQLINHKLEGTFEGTRIDPNSKITANFFGILSNFGIGLKMTDKSVLFVRANIGNASLFWNEEGLPKETINIFPYGDFDFVLDIEFKKNNKLRVGTSVIPPFSNYFAITPFVGLKCPL